MEYKKKKTHKKQALFHLSYPHILLLFLPPLRPPELQAGSFDTGGPIWTGGPPLADVWFLSKLPKWTDYGIGYVEKRGKVVVRRLENIR